MCHVCLLIYTQTLQKYSQVRTVFIQAAFTRLLSLEMVCFTCIYSLSVLLIPLILSPLPFGPTWGGLALAWLFHSLLIAAPPSFPIAWFAHFMNWNVSMPGIPLSIPLALQSLSCHCHLEHIISPDDRKDIRLQHDAKKSVPSEIISLSASLKQS